MNDLTPEQRDGSACIVCGALDTPMVPVGHLDGVQVFACTPCGAARRCPPWCIEPKLKMTGDPLHSIHVGNIGQATIRPGVTVEVNLTLDGGDDEPLVSLIIGPDDQLQRVELVTEFAAAIGWALANLTPREIRKFAEQLTAAAALGEAT